MKKNDLVELLIEDMSVEGNGVGKQDGFTYFVKDTVIGDSITARVTKLKKNYGFARVEKINSPSKDRVEPKCSFARQCGGCQIQAMSYEAQLEFKANKVRNNLIRLGAFDADFVDSVMEPIIGMDNPFFYRNKAQFPIGCDKEGNPVAGFYAGRTHSIIANTDCSLGVSENKEILDVILAYMKKNNVSAYNEETGKGLLRHVLIRYGFVSHEIMVCLVVNGKKLPKEETLIEELCKLDRMTSITLNTNTEDTNVILGSEIRTLWGQDYITDELDGIKFRISPLSFYQVNPVQTVKLYNKALDYAGLTGKETVWDLYCGIGTISLFLARKAGKVHGVEIVPAAINDAKQNAALNGITNAEFTVGKAEEVLPEFYKNAATDTDKDFLHPDVIVVDPPRKGCDELCLDTMLSMKPDRIVYVSCDSATLVRDLRILCDGGYKLEKVTPVDQFPHTVHVETVVLLSKLHKAKHHVSVKLDMDEMDITSVERR